jgi:hypothetical protein
MLKPNDVKIGHRYAFNAGKMKNSLEPIKFSGWTCPKYPTWKDAHNAELLVIDKKSKGFDAIVCFPDYPNHTFSLLIAFLNKIKSGAITCTCDISLLIQRGCQCGAFQREKTKLNGNNHT